MAPHLHRLVPTDRTKFTALHGAFRTGGTFLYVPPGVTVELPLQTLTYLDEENGAVFPHTLLVAGEDSDVTFIDRYAGPDLERACRWRSPRSSWAGRPACGTPRSRSGASGVTHLGVQRAEVEPGRHFRSLAIGFGASLARAEAEALLAEPGRVQRDARDLLRRRRPALRPSFRAGPRGVELHERPPVQGSAARPQPRRVLGMGARAPGRAEDERHADEPQHHPQRLGVRPVDPEPRDRGRTTSGAATPRAWVRSRRSSSST